MRARSTRFAVAILLTATVVGSTIAQEHEITLREMALDTWGTAAGLPHNQIQDIAQTPDGYLWLATWEGLVRFDGSRFTISHPLGDSGIRALAVGDDGALWVGSSNNGIARKSNDVWTVFTVNDGLAGNQVLDLLSTRSGAIWIATEADGVSHFDGDAFNTYSQENGLHDNTALTLAENSDGAIWVGTRTGISIVDGQQVRQLGQQHGLPQVSVRSLLAGPDGTMYAGTESGLYFWDRLMFTRQSQPTAASVSALTEDHRGTLWAGSLAEGLTVLQASRQSQLTTADGLPNNRIWSIFEDREQNIWIGTSGGLARLKRAPFWTLDRRNGLSDNNVRAVLETPDGSLWVATSNALNRINDSGIRWFGRAHGLATDSVQSLAWHDDALWVGTYGAGINILSAEQVVGTIRRPTLPSDHVRAILGDRNNQSVWVGTVAGLVRVTNTETAHFNQNHGLPATFVQALFQSSDQRIWVGTSSGAATFSNGRFDEVGSISGDVFGFAEDGQQRIWIATETGLWLSNTEQSEPVRFGKGNGLPHNVIFSVTVDGPRLWMTSNAGIFSASLDELVAAAKLTAAQISIQWFSEQHGLATRQANGGTQPVVAKRNNGAIAFATAGGVAMTIPSALNNPRDSSYQIPVDLHPLLIDGQPSPSASASQEARSFQFSFTGMHLTAPETVNYRYRLNGYEEDWTQTRAQTARYTSLRPGDYEFAVQARIDEGTWSPSYTHRLEITRLWYQTKLGQIAIALMTLLAGVLIFRWRLSALSRRAAELSREVEVRTQHLDEQSVRLLKANQEKTALLHELQKRSKDLEHQAKHDALTGLPNRRQFDERLFDLCKAASADGSHLIAAVIDIDHFKSVNDQFSHEAGDRALKTVARILREELEPHDTYYARYGGEEFVAAFPEKTLAQAADICEQFRKRIERHNFGRAHESFKVTLSVGLSKHGEQDDHESLLAAADQQLFAAKRAGRNRISF